jgi:DNA mismatch repair protein MutS
VCHGTETSSAVSLVGASIIHMAKVKANFIFATHLHELSKMTEIHQLTNVKQCHLSISFKGTDIIYERQIKDGAGTKLYGLEVARFLNVPELVMDEAYKIRNKYYNNDTIRKQSEYNKDVYLTVCAICNEKAVEIHHINFQIESNEHGLIEHTHMNQKANLVPLCKTHHNLVHDESEENELIILGYQPGNKLEYYIRPRLKTLQKSIIQSFTQKIISHT